MFEIGVGEIEKLMAMQDEANREWEAMTPEQRTLRALDDLRGMPGQAYLFPDGCPRCGKPVTGRHCGCNIVAFPG